MGTLSGRGGRSGTTIASLKEELSALRQALDVAKERGDRAYVSTLHLEVCLSGLDIGVLLIGAGPTRTILYANMTAGDFFGLTQSELIGSTRDALIEHISSHVDDRGNFLRRVTVPAGPYLLESIPVEIHSPIPRTLRWSSRPVQMLTGETVQLSVLTDVGPSASSGRRSTFTGA